MLAKTQRAKAAKHIAASGARGFLLLQQSVFADDRQLRQRSAGGDFCRVDVRQRSGKRRGLRLGVGNVGGQGGQERGFARLGGAGFQRVVMV